MKSILTEVQQWMHRGRHGASRFWEACHGYLEDKAALEGVVMLKCKEEEKLEKH